MKYRLYLSAFLCLAIGIWLCGCTSTPVSDSSPGLVPAPPTTPGNVQAQGAVPGGLSLQVDAITEGSVLPDVYTCKGAAESPELSWDNIPAGTKSLVLILEDPDAPMGTFTHWLLYNIPPDVRRIDRAQPNAKVLANSAQQGDTSAGSRGYYPPCPPIGQTHRYIFRLCALDYEISMPTADRDGIDRAMGGHVLGEVKVTTTFSR